MTDVLDRLDLRRAKSEARTLQEISSGLSVKWPPIQEYEGPLYKSLRRPLQQKVVSSA